MSEMERLKEMVTVARADAAIALKPFSLDVVRRLDGAGQIAFLVEDGVRSQFLCVSHPTGLKADEDTEPVAALKLHAATLLVTTNEESEKRV